MRAIVQRVSRASVKINAQVVGEIGGGLLIFLGVGRGDDGAAAGYLAERIANLRIFQDNDGKMNRSLLEEAVAAALVVSQFTLYADTRKGRRPGFDQAAPPQEANRLYQEFVSALRLCGVRVETGVFQSHMTVELVNDGPVTLLLDSEKK